MARSGNSLWQSQVYLQQDEMPPKTPYKDAELEAFRVIYKRMEEDGMKQGEIMEHFKTTFNLGYTAFYSRLRKVGRYVI